MAEIGSEVEELKRKLKEAKKSEKLEKREKRQQERERKNTARLQKRQDVADIIPLVFNQMIAFVQSAEVERFADRFYANPDSQYLTVVASPQDQAVVVYEGIDFFDSYQREHKGDEK